MVVTVVRNLLSLIFCYCLSSFFFFFFFLLFCVLFFKKRIACKKEMANDSNNDDERLKTIARLRKRGEEYITGPSRRRCLIMGSLLILLSGVLLASIGTWIWAEHNATDEEKVIFERRPYGSWKTWIIWWNTAWPLLTVIVFVWSLFHWIFMMEFRCN